MVGLREYGAMSFATIICQPSCSGLVRIINSNSGKHGSGSIPRAINDGGS